MISFRAVPEPDTAFHAVDRMYPSEVISQWCREAIHELQTVVGEPVEWMPGQFHFQGHTDPERMTERYSATHST